MRRARRAEILATKPRPAAPTPWRDPLSTRLLAEEPGHSHSTIARVWAKHDGEPRQAQTSKLSTDRQHEAKLRDVVGLCLDPPEHAIVVCVDEKSQIQALERTQPMRAVKPGRPERHPHDDIRHGTATLFAALEVATGQVTDQLASRNRHWEFLPFLADPDQTQRGPCCSGSCAWAGDLCQSRQ